MANIEQVSFGSLVRSGAVPQSQVNPIARAFEKLQAAGSSSKAQEAVKIGIAFGEGIRATGVGAVVGGLLGGVHGALPGGLDVRVPLLKTKHTVPADAGLAFAGLVISTVTANHPSGISPVLREAAAVSAGIFTFRQTNDAVIRLKQAKAGTTPGGGAAPVPGTIGKAQFAGDFPRTGWGTGFLSKGRPDVSEDPIVRAARGL